MAQQIKLNIELENGKQLTHYQQLTINQSLFGHQSFELLVPFESLEDSREVFFSKAHHDICGKSISFSFEAIDKHHTFKFTFKGIVVEIKLEYATDLSSFFYLKGFAPTCLLDGNSQRNAFLKMSLSDIFNNILRKYPGNVLNNTVNPKFSATQDYLVQYDESDFAFLSRLAAEYGEWFYYDGKELKVGLPRNAAAEDFFVNGLQTFEVSIALQPQRFQFSQYNYLKDEHFIAKSDNANLSGIPQLADFALEESENLFSELALKAIQKPVQSQRELSDLTKITKSSQATSLLSCKGSGEKPDLTIGSVIHVKRTVLLDPPSNSENLNELGKYRIIEITHHVDANGNYESNFKAIPEEAENPPLNPYYQTPVCHSELATVIDNQDPEKLGRVKVKFFWESDKIESDWIRVISQYSGEGKGLLFTPEIGSQVLIGYEDRSVLFPVVLGNVFHKKNGFSYSFDDNKIKSISTAAGNKIILNDESGKETITLSNSNVKETALVISFESNGSITLKTNGPVNIDAKKEIALTTDGEVKITAKQDISLSAGKNINIEAKGKLNLKGMETSMESNTNSNIKANAILQVKGATIQLN